MEQKKSKKLLIALIITVIILIILIGIAFLFLTTDMFKSNKTLFFQYAGQLMNNEESFIDSRIPQYFEKIGSTPYTDDGTFSLEVTNPNLEEEQINLLNNFNISFSGQVDMASSKSEQEISINYSDSVNFPINYRQVDSIIGLQTKYINNNYVAYDFSQEEQDVGQNDLGLAMVEQSVEGVENLTQIPFTEEELIQLKDQYMSIINEQLNESQFSKVNENNQDGYRLTLQAEEIRSLIVSILETLKNDQTTLNKLNEYLSKQSNMSTITTSTIDNYIESINVAENGTYEITIFVNNKNVSGIVIKENDSRNISIEKTENDNTIEYKLSATLDSENDDLNNVEILIRFAGLNDMNEVTENYEIGLLGQNINYRYKYQNNVSFTQSSNIEEFSDENSMILNNYDSEQVANFLNAVVERIIEVNSTHMEELGVEETSNPILGMFPSISNLNQTNDLISSISVPDLEIDTFNEKFKMYESTNLQGTTVRGLLSTIELNNESEENKITQIHFNGEEYEAIDQNITLIKEEVVTDAYYRVEFEMDENTGAIFRAVINQK